jgi:ATP-binding protein involved in chromosome partitioning
MISKEQVFRILHQLILDSKAKISEIIVKEDIISFSIYADKELDVKLESAQKFRQQAQNLLAINFPNKKLLISITNQEQATKPLGNKIQIPNVKKIILISSGKGGVGKSTISAYIAKYLLDKGNKVGLVDADIYGPSIPRMLGLKSFSPKSVDNKILPAEVEGLKVMSVGFLTQNDGAFAWRGPMTTKAIMQLFSGVNWGELDYLIVDTPPGTGDVHLSILSTYQIDGAFIVTIPSEISSDDVARCIDLHQKFDINIYGIIENMSYYYDVNLKQKITLFGEGAGQNLASKFNLKFIDSVEIIPNLTSVKFNQITNRIKINLNNINL